MLMDVTEVFPTIQGEGPFVGMPAIFIRLAVCNIKCYFCDTEFPINEKLESKELAERVYSLDPYKNIPLVVITGGEPMRQDLNELITLLFHSNYAVQIETNGTFGFNNGNGSYRSNARLRMASIVCSPKTARLNREILTEADAFKYIIGVNSAISPEDGLPMSSTQHAGARNRLARPWDGSSNPEKQSKLLKHLVYVQPLDEQDPVKNKANQDYCVNLCMRYGYRLSLQTHKLLGLP